MVSLQEDSHENTQRKNHQVKTEAEIEVRQLQTKEYQGMLVTIRD